jgi:hypothetical protein
MGIRNYLIEGGSGTGKTTVRDELERRGYHTVDGDRELAYWGDPETGRPMNRAAMSLHAGHKHWIWNVDKVRSLAANQDEAVTFFCGGSRNHDQFIHLFDGVFVLEADLDTVNRQIEERVLVDPEDWGGRPEERELIKELHHTRDGIPEGGIAIDATMPLADVVDEILRHVGSGSGA